MGGGGGGGNGLKDISNRAGRIIGECLSVDSVCESPLRAKFLVGGGGG